MAVTPETDPAAIVRRFCDAWPAGDIDALVGFFAEGATYHNIPMDPVIGKDAIKATIAGFASGNTIEFRTLHLATAGNVVLTERVDVFTFPDGRVVELPVSGTFELDRDGLITAWRDYFDLNMFMSQMSG